MRLYLKKAYPNEAIMNYVYPTPQDIGLRIPAPLIESRFNDGFEHALKGGHLTKVEYFRHSFRLGFRAAKLYLRELRRRQGIREFPLRGRIRLRAV
jgi:hypothetical protein